MGQASSSISESHAIVLQMFGSIAKWFQLLLQEGAAAPWANKTARVMLLGIAGSQLAHRKTIFLLSSPGFSVSIWAPC